MLFSYNWLQEFFPKKLPAPDKLSELLTMHFMEVEELEKKGKDWVLNIDVLPSRGGDCLNHFGVAKECGVVAGLKIKPEDYEVRENPEFKTKNFVKVQTNNKEDCRRYTTRAIVGVRVGPTPDDIKEKLEACGLQSINNVVDATNYVMLEMGQPLHAFDYDKLAKEGKQASIIVRRAKKGEKILSLDQKEYQLNESDLVIADPEGVLAIAGIKGGRRAEIDGNTKTIILESANFDPILVRKTSGRLNLRTDASWRFEQNLDPNLADIALERVTSLIQELAGGEVSTGIADIYPKKFLQRKLKLRLGYVNSLLGVEIPEKKMISILQSLGFGVKAAAKGQVIVTIPTWRQDVNVEADLVEEIGRVYGLENIKPVMPVSALIPAKRNENIFWENLAKNALKEAAFFEAYNYILLPNDQAPIFGFDPKRLVEIKNPVNIDQKYLRPSLIPHLLGNVKNNQLLLDEQAANKMPVGIKIFELSKVFETVQKKGKGEYKERRMLAGIIAGGENDFSEAKGIIEFVLNSLGIDDVWFDSYEATPENTRFEIWHPNICAEIKSGDAELGFVGEISPKILNGMGVNHRVVAFDFDFDELQKYCTDIYQYRPIPKFPAAVRDLALLVPSRTKLADVLNVIEIAGGELLVDVNLFDLYEGENLPQGKKNFAFRLVYQSQDRTLTSQEIDELQEKIIKALEYKPEWEIRK